MVFGKAAGNAAVEKQAAQGDNEGLKFDFRHEITVAEADAEGNQKHQRQGDRHGSALVAEEGNHVGGIGGRRIVQVIAAALGLGDGTGEAGGAVGIDECNPIARGKMGLAKTDGFVVRVGGLDGQHLHDAAAGIVGGGRGIKRERAAGHIFHLINATVGGVAVEEAHLIAGGILGIGLQGYGGLGGVDFRECRLVGRGVRDFQQER